MQGLVDPSPRAPLAPPGAAKTPGPEGDGGASSPRGLDLGSASLGGGCTATGRGAGAPLGCIPEAGVRGVGSGLQGLSASGPG